MAKRTDVIAIDPIPDAAAVAGQLKYLAETLCNANLALISAYDKLLCEADSAHPVCHLVSVSLSDVESELSKLSRRVYTPKN